MKFIRRPDLDNVTRLKIAVQAFLGLGVGAGDHPTAENHVVFSHAVG